MTLSSKNFIVNEIKRANNILKVVKSNDRITTMMFLQEDIRRNPEKKIPEEEYNP